MRVRCESTTLRLLEQDVVQSSEERHEEDEAENEDTDDGVVAGDVVTTADGEREPDTHSECGDVHHVRQDLEASVQPHDTGERRKADGDGA